MKDVIYSTVFINDTSVSHVTIALYSHFAFIAHGQFLIQSVKTR